MKGYICECLFGKWVIVFDVGEFDFKIGKKKWKWYLFMGMKC